jgi:trigger factor
MKVEIEDISPFEKKIQFAIPHEVVSREMDSTYRTLNRTVKIKGFRPGKVPRSILERYYKTQVEEEVLSKLITDSFGLAVEEHHLAPVSSPTLLERNFEAGGEFKYSVKVEVKPEISVEGYVGLPREEEGVQVTPEEIETRLKELQESQARLKTLEINRPIQLKDVVLVDFAGTLNGKPLEGWKVNDHLVEVGSKSLVGELDLKLVGLNLNEEKDILLPLPETYPKKELAGKTIQIHLKAKEIKEKILPVLDDEFAKDVGEYQTLADLKAALTRSLEEQKKNRAKEVAKEKLISILVEKHPFPVPQSMIERQIQTLMARTEIRLAAQGMKMEDSSLDRQKLRESFLPTAEKMVRGTLILEKIAHLENLSISETELDERLGQMAQQLNQRPEALKNSYQKKGLLEELRAQILEEKTLDFLLSKTKMKEELGSLSHSSPTSSGGK